MKSLFVIYILIFIGDGVWAQGKLTNEKRQEFEAQKVAYFTQELDLSPEEAAMFWPLYNEMKKNIRKVEESMRKEYKEIKEARNLKEEVYKEAVEKKWNHEAKIQEIKKDYFRKILSVIPASKVWRLDEAEHKFHRQLFEKLRRESILKK